MSASIQQKAVAPKYYRIGHCAGCRAAVYAAERRPGAEGLPMMGACLCEGDDITIIVEDSRDE